MHMRGRKRQRSAHACDHRYSQRSPDSPGDSPAAEVRNRDIFRVTATVVAPFSDSENSRGGGDAISESAVTLATEEAVLLAVSAVGCKESDMSQLVPPSI